MLEREQHHQADDRFVAVIAQPEPPLAGVRLKVPLVARNATAAGEDFFDIGVADPPGPVEEPLVAGHRGDPDQRLEIVAVGLGVGGGERPEPRRHRRVGHRVRDHVDHAIEPWRAAEVLGDGNQAVFRVLGGAEETRRADLAIREREIGRNRSLDRGVAHVVPQHLHQAAVIEVRVRELRGQDQIGIQIGARVVRRVDPLLAVGDGAIRQQQRLRIRMLQPGVQNALRRVHRAFETARVDLGVRGRPGRRLS